jgi:hypothetical protein
MIDLAPIRRRDFAAAAVLDAATGTVRLELTGNADADAIASLTTWLEAMHGAVTGAGARFAVVDVTRLEFMNSSCFKAFVTWISAAMEMPEPYRVTFLSNPKILWQRRSLHALVEFADDVVSIEQV